MNETSATSASGLSLLPDGIATLTAIHFTIIAVVAILVVIGLIWGIRAKRSRVKAAHDVISNAKEAGVPPEPISAEPAVEARKVEQSQTQTQHAPAPAPVAPRPAPFEPVQPVRSAPEPTPVSRDDDVPETRDRLADEPIAAASPMKASPATETVAPATVAPTEEQRAEEPRAEEQRAETPAPVQSYADGPVTQLKGLGPKVAAQLGALGVSTIGQMAALSESEAQSIDAQLGNFTGRMGRDRWIEQARLLAAGDKAGFEAVFGKL
jgi:predicted flap endonuclease-1-like 5' DNA nuclease